MVGMVGAASLNGLNRGDSRVSQYAQTSTGASKIVQIGFISLGYRSVGNAVIGEFAAYASIVIGTDLAQIDNEINATRIEAAPTH